MDFIFPLQNIILMIIPAIGDGVFSWASCVQWVESFIRADHCVISCAIKN